MSPTIAPTVRRADELDIPALDALNAVVQGLHAEAMPATFKQPLPGGTTAFFADALQREEVAVFVGEVDDAIVGYLFAEETHRLEGAFMHASHLLNVHHIAVDDSHRRMGVGRLLLAAADDWARTRGLTDVRLDHWAFNDDAHDFFTGLGFEVDNVRMSRPVSGPGRARFGGN
ncbi:MAG TPA: GNAT family N-acetyltransferase [Actinopolymorphaceae bacterium]